MTIETARQIAFNTKNECQYCKKLMTTSGLPQHTLYCYMNPKNIKLCPICDTPIKNWKNSATCSYACANKFFRTGPNNGSWKDSAYVTTCFYYHDKKCVVCSETLVVEVHHLDGNHDNNDPANLIPLCPTHHRYWHSKHRHLVENIITKYVTKWIVSVRQELNLQHSGPKPDAPPS